jgi:hypothetical protein
MNFRFYKGVKLSLGPLGGGEIKSASVGQLTSAALASLKQLINDVAARKAGLQATISALRKQQLHAERKLWLVRLLVVRLLLRSWRRRLEQQLSRTRVELVEAQDALGRCAIDLDFAFDEATFTAFGEFGRAFDELARSSRVWDITAASLTNRFVERTIADHSLNRTAVRLDHGSSDLISTRWTALRFGNANGEDLYIYPGFVLMRERSGSFALIDVRELRLRVASTNFIEEETVPPPDGIIVGRTWKKANKDGSRDRRFAKNYEIRVMLYGQLFFSSPTGLNEAYMVSNANAAETFSIGLEKYKRALNQLAERDWCNEAAAELSPAASDAPQANPGPEPEAQLPAEHQAGRPLRLYPVADLAVLVAVTLSVIVAVSLTMVPHPAPRPGAVSVASRSLARCGSGSLRSFDLEREPVYAERHTLLVSIT